MAQCTNLIFLTSKMIRFVFLINLMHVTHIGRNRKVKTHDKGKENSSVLTPVRVFTKVQKLTVRNFCFIALSKS